MYAILVCIGLISIVTAQQCQRAPVDFSAPPAAPPTEKAGFQTFVSHVWNILRAELRDLDLATRLRAPLKNFAKNADRALAAHIDRDMEHDRLLADPTHKKYMYIPPSAFHIVGKNTRSPSSTHTTTTTTSQAVLWDWVETVHDARPPAQLQAAQQAE